MNRATLLILAISCSVGNLAQAEIEVDASSENNLRLVYTPNDGNLELLVAPNTPLTILRLASDANLFTGEAPPIFDGLFDFYREDMVFKLNPSGFGSLPSFANVGAGRTITDVAQDLTASGAMVGSGGFDTVGGIFMVPEPNSTLLVATLFGIVAFRLRKTRSPK